jgi:DNA polymerase III subunit gamma/tau
MGQALYRKYRSKSFADVVGQDHITKTLQSAIKSGKVSHAYLFTGPRGVGKTSVARILAHEVNGLEYKDESIHLDIIEIDAASNRRIDEIRDLRDKVRVAPAAAKYKVYIIDEVHMLTREAFNALLKTLEEPPAHCIFILATTEAHKLPETIVSRTQRFEFKPVSKAQAAEHLADLSKREKINISPEALELLAEFGNGSFRDSISYLDQLSGLGKDVSEQDVRSVLGLPAAQSITKLLEVVESGDSAQLLSELTKIEQQGVNAGSVAVGLSTQIRGLAVSGEIKNWQISLLKQLMQVSASSRPQETLEIVLLGAGSRRSGPQPQASKAQPKPAEQKAAKTESLPSVSSSFSLSDWPEVIERSKKEAASIYTALRLAKPSYKDGTLSLAFQFPLHQKKLNQAKNKEMVAKLIAEVSGNQISIESVLSESRETVEPEADARPAALGTISQIFGNAEVMEA